MPWHNPKGVLKTGNNTNPDFDSSQSKKDPMRTAHLSFKSMCLPHRVFFLKLCPCRFGSLFRMIHPTGALVIPRTALLVLPAAVGTAVMSFPMVMVAACRIRVITKFPGKECLHILIGIS